MHHSPCSLVSLWVAVLYTVRFVCYCLGEAKALAECQVPGKHQGIAQLYTTP